MSVLQTWAIGDLDGAFGSHNGTAFGEVTVTQDYKSLALVLLVRDGGILPVASTDNELGKLEEGFLGCFFILFGGGQENVVFIPRISHSLGNNCVGPRKLHPTEGLTVAGSFPMSCAGCTPSLQSCWPSDLNSFHRLTTFRTREGGVWD